VDVSFGITGATEPAGGERMRVLVATDGSEGARAAIDWLEVFPLAPAAEVLVLAVAEVTTVPPELPRVPELDLLALAAARRAAEEARDALCARWPAAAVRVLGGHPPDAILGVADDWGADLVVVGARGLGAVHRFLLGSVSTAVVHAARCPVLVVKPHPPAGRRLVIGVDGSADSLAAARFVAGLALAPGTSVRLVGVVPRPYTPRSAPETVMPLVRTAIESIVAGRRAELARVLATVAERFAPCGATVEYVRRVGTPAEEILRETEERPTDLVVVGARGLGGVKRLVLGSVSDRVLHHARCPVLVVKDGA
jgi:nucleotide-binding universal stress UspA family protein